MSLVGLAVLFPELPLLGDDNGVVAFCLIDGVFDSTISYFNYSFTLQQICKLESYGHTNLTDNNVLKIKSNLIDKKDDKEKAIKGKQILC